MTQAERVVRHTDRDRRRSRPLPHMFGEVPPDLRRLLDGWVCEHGHLFEQAYFDRPFLRVVGDEERGAADQAYEALARLQVQVWLDAVPACLTASDREWAAAVIERLVSVNPGATPMELLWILAADAFRPGERGRAPKWTGVDGRNFFALVEAGLGAMGLQRNRRKGLRQVIAAIRAAAPKLYGRYSEERLRKAYYDARRAQSGK